MRCAIDPLNLILLIVAVIVGLRLRAVLGTRNDEDAGKTSRRGAYGLNRDAFNGQQKPQEVPREVSGETQGDPAEAPSEAEREPFGDEASPAAKPKLRMVDENYEPVSDYKPFEPAPTNGRGLAFLRQADPQFDAESFVDCAQRAYEMILMAFAAGELSDVRDFLGDDVHDGFADAIAARQAAGETLATKITRLDRPVLEDARINNGIVQLDVRYRAELVSYLHTGEESDEAEPAPSRDLWTFERPLAAEGPNWRLVATQAEG